MKIVYHRNSPPPNRIEYTLNSDEPDQSMCKSGSKVVMIYGYPYNKRQSKWLDSEQILSMLEKNGESFVHEIDGVYTIIYISNDIVNIYTDRYGLYNAFYYEDGNSVIISDSISEITNSGVPVEYDKLGVYEYLSYGYKIGLRTTLKNINQFDSGSIYTLDQKIKNRKYWSFNSTATLRSISKEKIRQLFNQHILQVYDFKGRISLPLSGGLDSRMILSSLMLDNRYKNIHAYTYGIKKTNDINIARIFAQKYKIDHTIHELNESYIQDIPIMTDKEILSFNGLVPVPLFLHMKYSLNHEEKVADTIMWGLNGDEIWRCPLGSLAERVNDIDELTGQIFNYMKTSKNYLETYTPFKDTKVVEQLKSSIKAELNDLVVNSNYIDAANEFGFRTFAGNWSSSFFKMSGKIMKVFPAYFNSEIIPMLRHINSDERSKGTWQKYIISKNTPYLASKLLSTYMPIISSVPLFIKSKMNRLYLKVINNANKLFPKLNLGNPPRHNYTDWLPEYHYEYLKKVLEYDNMVTKDLFDREELEIMFEKYCNGDRELVQFFGSLISLELFLKQIAPKIL